MGNYFVISYIKNMESNSRINISNDILGLSFSGGLDTNFFIEKKILHYLSLQI